MGATLGRDDNKKLSRKKGHPKPPDGPKYLHTYMPERKGCQRHHHLRPNSQNAPALWNQVAVHQSRQVKSAPGAPACAPHTWSAWRVQIGRDQHTLTLCFFLFLFPPFIPYSLSPSRLHPKNWLSPWPSCCARSWVPSTLPFVLQIFFMPICAKRRHSEFGSCWSRHLSSIRHPAGENMSNGERRNLGI